MEIKEIQKFLNLKGTNIETFKHNHGSIDVKLIKLEVLLILQI